MSDRLLLILNARTEEVMGTAVVPSCFTPTPTLDAAAILRGLDLIVVPLSPVPPDPELLAKGKGLLELLKGDIA